LCRFHPGGALRDHRLIAEIPSGTFTTLSWIALSDEAIRIAIGAIKLKMANQKHKDPELNAITTWIVGNTVQEAPPILGFTSRRLKGVGI
jgi:hypothetical protein